VERGLANVAGYEYEWFSFDNRTGAVVPLSVRGRTAETRIPIPATDASDLMVRIRTESPTELYWKKAVDVYLRGRILVGIEREI
jgi:hypothetical protein